MSPARRGRELGPLARAAHDLRSSLNGIRTWALVLEGRLAGASDPQVRRALEGIRRGIAQQVDVIENQLEANAVQPPLTRSAAMTKRNDAQPEIPDDSPHRERPERPQPEMKPGAPGGRDAAKAEEHARNKSTREGGR